MCGIAALLFSVAIVSPCLHSSSYTTTATTSSSSSSCLSSSSSTLVLSGNLRVAILVRFLHVWPFSHLAGSHTPISAGNGTGYRPVMEKKAEELAVWGMVRTSWSSVCF